MAARRENGKWIDSNERSSDIVSNPDGTAIGSSGKMITASPTVTAGAYSALDAVGGLLTFTNAARASGGSIMINSVTITDLGNQRAALILVLFNQTFTATTDNQPFDPTDADLANLVAIVPISAGDYQAFNDNAAATVSGLGIVATMSGTDLFGQLYLPSGSAPTYTSTSDLKVKVGLVQLT